MPKPTSRPFLNERAYTTGGYYTEESSYEARKQFEDLVREKLRLDLRI